MAVDPKNVVVTIPAIERERPDSFISRVRRLPVTMLPTEARVQINARKGSIVMTGDVEISPVVISYQGADDFDGVPRRRCRRLARPILGEKTGGGAGYDGDGRGETQRSAGGFDQLKVPAEDRISIIQELHKTGKLHAELMQWMNAERSRNISHDQARFSKKFTPKQPMDDWAFRSMWRRRLAAWLRPLIAEEWVSAASCGDGADRLGADRKTSSRRDFAF